MNKYEAEYEAEILKCMDELRRDHPDGNYPSPFSEHEPDECAECDARRRLLYED